MAVYRVSAKKTKKRLVYVRMLKSSKICTEAFLQEAREATTPKFVPGPPKFVVYMDKIVILLNLIFFDKSHIAIVTLHVITHDLIYIQCVSCLLFVDAK